MAAAAAWRAWPRTACHTLPTLLAAAAAAGVGGPLGEGAPRYPLGPSASPLLAAAAAATEL